MIVFSELKNLVELFKNAVSLETFLLNIYNPDKNVLEFERANEVIQNQVTYVETCINYIEKNSGYFRERHLNYLSENFHYFETNTKELFSSYEELEIYLNTENAFPQFLQIKLKNHLDEIADFWFDSRLEEVINIFFDEIEREKEIFKKNSVHDPSQRKKDISINENQIRGSSEKFIWQGSLKSLAYLILQLQKQELIQFKLEKGNLNKTELATLIKYHFVYLHKGEKKEINIQSLAQSLNENNAERFFKEGSTLFEIPHLSNLGN